MRRIVSLMILLLLLVGMFALASNVGLVHAQVPAQTPTVTIVNPLSPTNSSLFEFNSSPSILNSTFTAAVYISTVTNLEAWRVELTWDNTIINFATAWVPTDNVFEPAVDNGATLLPEGPNPNIGTGLMLIGCSDLYTSNSPPFYPVNVSGEGLLFDVNFTIAAIPNATQTLSTNLEILNQLPNNPPGYLASFIFIYPSTTETAVLAESATVTISQRSSSTATTVYINSDGSVSPSNAPISSVDNVTYTFTGNLSYPTYNGIVVERNNILIDGNGYTVQGLTVYYSNTIIGLSLMGVSNVTIEDANVEGFQFGISLVYSSNNTISGNNATANSIYGIYLCSSSNNNTVSGNNITTNGLGIDVGNFSNNNVISGNKITANSDAGIDLDLYCSNNIVSWNNVTANGNGIDLSESSNNTVSGNNVNNTVSVEGIDFFDSSNNTVSGNDVTGNYRGIYLLYNSNNNIISGNNVTANIYGIILIQDSSNNAIYHNNFVGNLAQASVDSTSVGNAWDNGYPCGGNYWSDYNGTDLYSGPYQNVTGSDGIGDTPYVIDANNTDDYPLMGMFSDFSVAQGVDVQVMSNSTVSDFQFNGTAILFNVSGVNGTTGFCNVHVPTSLLNGTLSVFVNGTQVQYSLLPSSNSTQTYLYFTYGHSTEQVAILREFPDSLIVAMFMLATLPAVAIHKKKHSRS